MRGGKWALLFVLITIFVDTIGVGIIIPVMPTLIQELTGQGLSEAAAWGGWLIFSYALMQFFSAPVLGSLSDRFGRRPILLLSLAALGIDYLFMAWAPTIFWLFIGRVVAGAAGAGFATANAYVADISEGEERSKNFGLIGAAWGLGFITGPVIGGFLVELGPRAPFYAAAAIALLNVIYGLIVLPETLKPENRRAFSWRRANTLGALLQMRNYPVVIGLFAAVFFYLIAHDANPATWTYYNILKFGWTEREIGYSLAVVGIMVMIVQGGLIRVAIDTFGEEKTACLGLCLGSLGFVGYAFATQSWMMYAFTVLFSMMGLAMPALRGIMSRAVPADAQGELQGALTSLMSLTMIIAPVLLTQIFRSFTQEGALVYFPGAAFLTAAGMMLISMLLAMRSLRALK